MQKVSGESLIRNETTRERKMVGPKAMVEDLRHDAAVGVVPASDGCAVPLVQCVLKDGVMRIELLPGVRGGIVDGELSVGRGSNPINR